MLDLVHRHVLEDHISGFENKPNPHHLSVSLRPVVYSVLAHAGHEAAVEAALSGDSELSLRRCGPGEWLVVSRLLSQQTVEERLSAVAGLSFLDQSDGKVVMSIAGPSVRRILAKCVAVDLHADVFAEGFSANMLCCHVGANVARTGGDAFEIIVPRSYAGTVFEEMTEMGREFALTASFAG